VSTLSQFTTYVETASNNQRLDIEHIQAYVIDELQRQNSAANHTKQICEQKLVELQYQLEDVSSLFLVTFDLFTLNPLKGTGNYSATLNKMKFVH